MKRYGWILMLALVLTFATVGVTMAFELPDGSYQGVGTGHNSDIKVEVVVEDAKILEINVLEHAETPYISDAGFDGVIEQILDKQSLEVEAISGATITSNGVLEAVADALNMEN